MPNRYAPPKTRDMRDMSDSVRTLTEMVHPRPLSTGSWLRGIGSPFLNEARLKEERISDPPARCPTLEIEQPLRDAI